MRYELHLSAGEWRGSRHFASDERYAVGDEIAVSGDLWRIEQVEQRDDAEGPVVRLVCVPALAREPTGCARTDDLMHDQPQPFFANHVSSNGQAFIKLGGECDAATLDQLNGVLQEAMAEQPDELIVDLSQTTFVDSLTLGSLTAAAKQLRTNGGRFRVVGATATEVRRALQITGLDDYLEASGEAQPLPSAPQTS
jgi:anti-sigma B factor antagonist